MKGRLIAGSLLAGAVIAIVAFSASTFHARAQEKPEIPGSFSPSTPLPPPNYQPLAPSSEPTLAELITNLRELRKQEQQLTRTIKQRIMAQKQSLNEAEKELGSLGIEATEHQPLPSALEKPPVPPSIDEVPPKTGFAPGFDKVPPPGNK